MLKIIKNVLFALTLSFLALGTTPALADAATEAESASLIKDIFSVDADYENDVVQKWLKQLFGAFIFTDGTTGSSSGSRGDSEDQTILTTAIGFSNILAMIFGIVIVSYLFIAGSLNTAHHGEVLGKNWSSVWLPARLALGFGLIMPASTFGGGAVSTIQALTIWMILVGSNAANVLWSQLTDKISSGASVNSNIMIPITVPKQVIEILSCRVSYLNEVGDGKSFEITTTGLNTNIPLEPAGDGKYKLPSIPWKDKMDGVDFGQCGQISLNTPGFTFFGDDDDSSNKVFKFLTDANKTGKDVSNKKYIDYINELIPHINEYYLTLGGSTGIGVSTLSKDDPAYTETKLKTNALAQKLFTTGVKISTDIPQDVKAKVVTGSFSEEFSTELKKGGWGTAGLWFMRVGAVQNMIAEIVAPIGESTTVGIPNDCLLFDALCRDDTLKKNARMANDISVASSLFTEGAKLYSKTVTMKKSESDIDPAGYIDLRGEAARQASSSGVICDGNNCSIQGNSQLKSIGMARSILNALSPVDDEVKISGSSSVTDTSGLASPFATAASIGNMSINIMQGMMIAAAASGAASGYAEAASKAGGPGKMASIAGSLLGAGATLAMAVAGYFGAIGITLAFVIPFMPAMLWMMMMIGYLLLVIESMIATPFAVIMMVTPEGEGISGQRLERAIGLIALVILRPSLMVMGLVAAITLSSVSFSIYNQFFWYTASTAVTGSMFTVLVIVGMYTMGLFQICKYSITVMSRLPDQILDWMSFNGNRAFSEDAAAGVEKGVDGGVKTTQSAISTITSDFKARMRRNLGKPGGGGGGEPGGQ